MTDAWGINNKSIAKTWAGRFACGSSVTKNASGTEEIVIQGDVGDDVYDYILEHFPEIPESNIEMESKK